MTPFRSVEGPAYPLALSNVDTDTIIAAEHLKTVHRSGLGKHAFGALRSVPGNVFGDPRYAGAPIVIALENFGCGSSREHAVWALADLGIRAVIAPSFSDIFAGNAFKNGIAAVELASGDVRTLLAVSGEHRIRIDLENQMVASSAGHQFQFAMDGFRRQCLLEGIDEIGLTLAHESAIRAFELRTAT